MHILHKGTFHGEFLIAAAINDGTEFLITTYFGDSPKTLIFALPIQNTRNDHLRQGFGG